MMANMSFQQLDLNKKPVGSAIAVQFNPTEYSLNKSNQFADVAIPGLDSPVIQFVRGDSEKLSLELFFDSTENGTGAKAVAVTAANGKLDQLYRLIKIESKTHAPPIVRITWSDFFPNTAAGFATESSTVFDGVIESADRKFTLFNSNGVPLRATLTLSIRQYKTLEEQLQELNLQSADHTRVHVVRQGESLPQIAYDEYKDPARWRLIADHNKLLNPRQLQPGDILELPPTNV
jgi:nucleoid-associated protein YgaU